MTIHHTATREFMRNRVPDPPQREPSITPDVMRRIGELERRLKANGPMKMADALRGLRTHSNDYAVILSATHTIKIWQEDGVVGLME